MYLGTLAQVRNIAGRFLGSASAIIVAPPPTPTPTQFLVQPTRSGDPVIGSTQTGVDGTPPSGYTIVSRGWYADGVALGDTDTGYVLQALDEGKFVDFRNRATKSGESDIWGISLPVFAVVTPTPGFESDTLPFTAADGTLVSTLYPTWAGESVGSLASFTTQKNLMSVPYSAKASSLCRETGSINHFVEFTRPTDTASGTYQDYTVARGRIMANGNHWNVVCSDGQIGQIVRVVGGSGGQEQGYTPGLPAGGGGTPQRVEFSDQTITIIYNGGTPYVWNIPDHVDNPTGTKAGTGSPHHGDYPYHGSVDNLKVGALPTYELTVDTTSATALSGSLTVTVEGHYAIVLPTAFDMRLLAPDGAELVTWGSAILDSNIDGAFSTSRTFAVDRAVTLPNVRVQIRRTGTTTPVVGGSCATPALSAPFSDRFGVNIGADIPLKTNIAYAPWRAVNHPLYDPVPPPYTDANGDMVSFPPGVTQVVKLFPYYAPEGESRPMEIAWDGGSNSSMGSPVGLYNEQALLSNNVSYANRITTDYATVDLDIANTATGLVLNSAGTTPGNFPRNFRAKELTTSGGSTIKYPGFVSPTWVSVYSDYPSVRGMDFLATNGSYICSSSDGFHSTLQTNREMQEPTRAGLEYGSGTSKLLFRASSYWIGDYTDLADILPLTPLGAGGNQISITILAPSGAGSVAITDGTMDVIVTPAIAAATPAGIMAQIRANTDATTLVGGLTDAELAEIAARAGVVAPLAKTYLTGGGDGYMKFGGDLRTYLEACNEAGTRPKCTLPISANVAWADEFCDLVEEVITNPASKPVGAELGNETWNFAQPVTRVLAAWGVVHGRTGSSELEIAQKEYAARSITVLGRIKTRLGDDVDTEVGVQSSNSAIASILVAAGVNKAAGIDATVGGPYIYFNEALGTTSGDDPAWFATGYVSANEVVAQSLANKVIAEAAGMRHGAYEYGQHSTGGDLTAMTRRHRSAEMGRLINYTLDRQARVAGIGTEQDGMYYKAIGAIATNIEGAWGLDEYPFQTPLSAKKIAHNNMRAGTPGAYYIYPTKPVIVGTATAGSVQTLTFPKAYNQASRTIQWKLNGSNVGAGAVTYTSAAGSLLAEITLTGLDGLTNVYTTAAVTIV